MLRTTAATCGSRADVGPIARQFSTRNGGDFDHPHVLTSRNELVRGQVAERAVGPTSIVVEPPRFDLGLRVRERRELVHVQTLIAQPAIKRFDERVFDGFARLYEIKLYAATIRPVLQRARLKLRAVIDRD